MLVDKVDLVFSIKTIFCVIKLIYIRHLIFCIYILDDMCENLFLGTHTMIIRF
jgi:hypothetical protein